MNKDQLYTRKSLALHLNVTTRSICRWEKIGLPVIHIGGISRYNLAEVYKWITLKEVSKKLHE